MNELTSRLNALSPAQRALLDLRLRKDRDIGAMMAPTIPRRSEEGHPPLSLDQERIWFIQQLDPESPAYNIYSASRFNGALRLGTMTRALNEIVRRHEIMRTRFEEVGGRPVQVITPSLEVNLPLVDLCGLSHAQREQEAESMTSGLVRRHFDLTQLPLFRSVLVRVDEEEYICATAFHHIITDWVSFHIFERELALLYEAFSLGRPSPLPELSIQYADFAAWQRQWLEDEAIAAHLDYWRGQLAGAPLVLDLPRDRPRPATQTPWGYRQPLVLSKAGSDAIRRLAQKEEVTLFIALLAVFKVLMFRISGQEKLIVGSPIANRNQAETEPLLGFFINQLALCTDFSGNPTFRQLLNRVRETAVGAYAHQEMPFGKLVEELQPERALSHTPVTQVVFLFLNPEQQGILKFAGLNVLPYNVDGKSSKFDMTLSLWDNEAGFEGWIEYNTDLFDAPTIIRLTEQFRTLLASIAVDPDQPISNLQILTEPARHQLLVEWSGAETRAQPPAGCVHQLYEAQVKDNPDALAVVSGGEKLTHGELNRRADSLARYLQGLNVGPETAVGLLMERSAEMIVAMLAVLKAGGAYLPFDPNEPPERVAFMLEDVGAPVLLSHTELVQKLPAINAKAVCLDRESEWLTAGAEPNPAAGVSGQNLAYVIYTSGSTGMPKGVGTEHRSLLNLVEWHQRMYHVTPADRATLIAGTAFDASVWEVWPYLIAGASLHIPDEETRSSVTGLISWLKTEAISLCFLPTPLAEAALAEEWPEDISLKGLLTGGDRLHQTAADNSRFAFFNHYGPTENTVVTTSARVHPATDRITPVPIGRPISNIEVYLLDSHLQPVPAGADGELCIGGVGLARGYLNRPDITAEKFVPHPFVSEPGARLYRTGDLARYRSDGQLEFRGRRDSQVKIRGFRIELGEIENTLNRHPSVRDSLVAIHEEPSGPKRLVAYVIPENENFPVTRLREYLDEKLPDYMVPSAFVRLTQFPLTPNGKIDRKALPPPDVGFGRPKIHVKPRTAIEKQLAKIWSGLLRVEHVAIDDNFFELGGDSILSIQVVAQARRAGLRLTPKQIFQHQTIAELALVAGGTDSQLTSEEVVLGKVPLTPIQQWFFEQDLPNPHHFNQSLLFELRERIEPELLEQALACVCAHHDAFHLRFNRKDGVWRQENNPPDQRFPFTCFDFSELGNDRLEGAIGEVSEMLQTSLDLQAGPLIRAAQIQPASPDSGWLLVIVHHLIVDGVSWRIFLEDLHAAYEQLSKGKRADLPQKTTSFKRWAERLMEYAHSSKPEGDAGIWTNDAAKRVVDLPVDYPGGRNTVASSRSIEVSLSEQETITLLQKVSRAFRVNIEEVIIIALAMALQKFTGNDCVLVDCEGHGREDIFDDLDLSRTIGWFTSIHPVMLDLGHAHDVNDAVKLGKEQLRSFKMKGLSYALLRYLRAGEQVSDRLKSLPQAQLSFNYLGQLDQALPESSFLVSAQQAPGFVRSPEATRPYLIEINGGIVGGQLILTWTFSTNLHAQANIEALARDYSEALKTIMALSESGEVAAYTPSDFPLANIDQTSLDLVVAEYPQIEDIYALSPIQQGLLFQTLSAPESGVYTEQMSCDLIGRLNLSAFETAWQRAIARHSILRTAFLWSELEQPLQIVLDCVRLEVRLEDLRGFQELEQRQHLEEFLAADREQGFDLSKAPLMRLSLFQIDSGAYRCVWSHHHLLLDGWSIPLVLKEVMEDYNALCANETLCDQPARAFRNYIEWLRRQDHSKAEEYWRRALKDAAPTCLGSDVLPGEAVAQRSRYQDETIRLSAAQTQLLLDFIRQEQLTLNTLVQGAWAILLSHYSGMKKVLFGVTVSGRPAEVMGIEEMVGLFINTLPVAAYVPSGAPVLSWLKELQTEQAEMRQYEYVPLPQQWSDLPLGRQLFETLLVFENYPIDDYLDKQSQGLKIRNVEMLVRTRYPLTLVALPGPELCFNIAYDRRVFLGSTIAGILAHLRGLLLEMAADPAQSIVSLPGLPEAERQRLQVGRQIEPRSSSTYVPPRNAVEELVSGIWAELLGIERVGIEDNFFELGGHSLIAAQILSRIREIFEIEFSLRHLFEASTVANLAERIQSTSAGARDHSTGIPRVPRTQKLPLSFAQEPLWQLNQVLPGNPFFNVSSAIQLSGKLNVMILERALQEIVRRHEVLRTSFTEVDGEPVQVIRSKGSFKLKVIDLRELGGAPVEAEVARLTAKDARYPFDLEAGPLFRITLLRLADEEYRGLLTLHHIVADAWAVGIFVKELGSVYEAFLNGKLSSLPRLRIQYADYAVWQRQRIRDGTLAHQLAYWKKQLAAPLKPINLPSDFPRSGEITFETAVRIVRLPAELAARIKGLSRAEGVTLFMILMTALQILLHRYTGQQDIRVGTLVANRDRAETEDLIGLFLNTAIIRTIFSPGLTYRRVLRQVRETVLAAFNNQELPFELMVEALEGDGDITHTSLAEVLFILQNAPAQPLELTNLSVSPLEEADSYGPEVSLTTFDLVLILCEGPNGLEGSLRYKTSLFRESTIDKMISDFQNVLTAITEEVEDLVSRTTDE
jgi:amino acid adenylation domain-containing protein/non-ribosomal peptide synthase protein (TIGR01720 family)